ncbi:MAG: Hsp20/alpha crystallin family protein [Acidobacteria bacterium]|nr:Hsp20/alpha crystallin family protein [Acidobacteriota bacterium]
MPSMTQFSLIPSAESTELADDIRELFDEVSRALDREHRAYSGECHPSLDVLETDTSVEIIVDVAGVPAQALRLLFRSGVLIVAGEKAPGAAGDQQTFHLVEREFGRFARAVRLNGAFDLQQSRATLRDGELTIVLPKLDDRRGRPHRIPVTSPPRT